MSAVYSAVHSRSNFLAPNQNPAHFAHLLQSCYILLHFVTPCDTFPASRICSKPRPPRSLHQHESASTTHFLVRLVRHAPSVSRADIPVRHALMYSSVRSPNLTRIFAYARILSTSQKNGHTLGFGLRHCYCSFNLADILLASDLTQTGVL
jgi:hypothetical protein